jgi:hypothetical protein
MRQPIAQAMARQISGVGLCVSAALPSRQTPVTPPVLACFLRQASLEIVYAKL